MFTNRKHDISLSSTSSTLLSLPINNNVRIQSKKYSNNNIQLLPFFMVGLIGICIGYLSSSFGTSTTNCIQQSMTSSEDNALLVTLTTKTEQQEVSHQEYEYISSYLEQYVIDNAEQLGFADELVGRSSPSHSCQLINNASYSDIYEDIHTYILKNWMNIIYL